VSNLLTKTVARAAAANTREKNIVRMQIVARSNERRQRMRSWHSILKTCGFYPWTDTVDVGDIIAAIQLPRRHISGHINFVA
jgi:hypothetical protein